MFECKHGLLIGRNNCPVCEDELMSLSKEEILSKLVSIMNDAPSFCHYACPVKYIEHYHIDEHTLTFRKPEVNNGSI